MEITLISNFVCEGRLFNFDTELPSSSIQLSLFKTQYLSKRKSIQTKTQNYKRQTDNFINFINISIDISRSKAKMQILQYILKQENFLLKLNNCFFIYLLSLFPFLFSNHPFTMLIWRKRRREIINIIKTHIGLPENIHQTAIGGKPLRRDAYEPL